MKLTGGTGEWAIENWSKQRAIQLGWWVRKFTSPATRAVPDDIFAKGGRVFFVEFKAPGQIPTPAQVAEHREMQRNGLTVYVVSATEDFEKIMAVENMEAELAPTRSGWDMVREYVMPRLRSMLWRLARARNQAVSREEIEGLADLLTKLFEDCDAISTAMEQA